MKKLFLIPLIIVLAAGLVIGGCGEPAAPAKPTAPTAPAKPTAPTAPAKPTAPTPPAKPTAPTPREIVNIEFISPGPSGSFPYAWAVTASEILRELHPWLRATVEEVMGGTRALAETGAYPLERKSRVMIVSTTPVDWGRALEGGPPFKQKITDLRFVTKIMEGARAIITYNPEIRSPQDLIGKRIVASFKGSTPEMEMSALLRDAWGIYDQVDISHHKSMDYKDLLVTGATDAAFGIATSMAGGKWGQWTTPPWMLQILTTRETSWVGITEEDVEKINERNPWKAEIVVLPKGALGKDPPEDVAGLSTCGCVTCWDVADEEIIYELVKFLDENAEELTERLRGLPMGGQWMSTFPALTEDMVHPAALRYYSERGYKIGG